MILNLEGWVPLSPLHLASTLNPHFYLSEPSKAFPQSSVWEYLFFAGGGGNRSTSFFPSPRFSILIVLRDTHFAFSFNFTWFNVDRLPTKAQIIRTNEKFNSKNFVRIVKKGRCFYRSCRKSWCKPKVPTGILSERINTKQNRAKRKSES